MVSILARLRAMGVIGAEPLELPAERIDLETIRAAFRQAAQAGIGRQLAAYVLSVQRPSLQRLLASLEGLQQATEESPVPRSEWPALEGIFGAETLAHLLGVSPASVHRYRRAEREASDRVVARLHFLALLVADLSGAYTEEGVRLWFARPRTLLQGRRPSEILSGDWSPEQPQVARVKELGRSLTGSPAT